MRDGDVAAALRAYRAPLLVESEVPRLVEARCELEGALRRAALEGASETLWAWLQTESCRDDLAALRKFLTTASPDDPRLAAASLRLRALRLRWGAPA